MSALTSMIVGTPSPVVMSRFTAPTTHVVVGEVGKTSDDALAVWRHCLPSDSGAAAAVAAVVMLFPLLLLSANVCR